MEEPDEPDEFLDNGTYEDLVSYLKQRLHELRREMREAQDEVLQVLTNDPQCEMNISMIR